MITTRADRIFAAVYACAFLTCALLLVGDPAMGVPLWVAYLIARDHL